MPILSSHPQEHCIGLPLHGNFFPNLKGRLTKVNRLFIVYLFIARWVLSYIGMFVFRMTGIRMSAKIRLEYLKALFALPISAIDTLPSGQASNTITTTANVLQIGISEKLGTIIQFTTLLIAAIIIGFVYNPLLTIVTASIVPFLGITYGVLVPVIMKRTKAVEHADEKAAAIAGEVLGSIRMIVACGAESRIAQKYSGWIEESRRRGMRLAPIMGVQFAPMFFAIYSTMALSFWFGFQLYSKGRIRDVGDIVSIFLFSRRFNIPILGNILQPNSHRSTAYSFRDLVNWDMLISCSIAYCPHVCDNGLIRNL